MSLLFGTSALLPRDLGFLLGTRALVLCRLFLVISLYAFEIGKACQSNRDHCRDHCSYQCLASTSVRSLLLLVNSASLLTCLQKGVFLIGQLGGVGLGPLLTLN
jgi:hypothetical protein